jgi:hypothetical protein
LFRNDEICIIKNINFIPVTITNEYMGNHCEIFLLALCFRGTEDIIVVVELSHIFLAKSKGEMYGEGTGRKDNQKQKSEGQWSKDYIR